MVKSTEENNEFEKQRTAAIAEVAKTKEVGKTLCVNNILCLMFVVTTWALIIAYLLVRVPAHLGVEEMLAVTYPVLLPLPGAETHTNKEDVKTGLKELKADKMETIVSW